VTERSTPKKDLGTSGPRGGGAERVSRTATLFSIAKSRVVEFLVNASAHKKMQSSHQAMRV